MHLFYVPDLTGNEILLDETESKHAVRVLRLKRGSRVNLVDGKGGFYAAEITDDHAKACRLTVLESTSGFGKRHCYLHLAIAPPKSIDRFEWFLEKATEIGIDEITPLLTEHSERKHLKPERLEKILVSAMKQSVKAYLPKLNRLTSFPEFLHTVEEENRFVAHCYEGEKPHLKNYVNSGENIVVLVGPEGDFSAGEVAAAKGKGFREITLGTSRLRTETAGVVACHICNLACE